MRSMVEFASHAHPYTKNRPQAMTKPIGLDSPYILEGTSENFETLVLENSERGPVLVNYWSPKAGPCLRLYPILDKLIHEFEGKMLLINVNADEHKRPALNYGVNSLPTMKLFKNRAVVETLHGYQPESDLRSVFIKYVPRRSDTAVRDALQAYEKGNIHEALTLLAEATMDDPQNMRIPITMAKLLMRDDRHAEGYQLLSALPGEQREEPEIRDLLGHLGFLLAARDAPNAEILRQTIERDPENLDARYQLCALKLVEDDYEGAMELLLDIMRMDNEFRDGVGRKGLLTLFNMLSSEHALVTRYRKKMLEFTH